MAINFKTIRWKNFLSTGNYFTEIRLDKNPSTLIIGSNGAGKSTILDALTFSLFGKPFRKINKPTLMNSINSKECVVECEFDIGKKKYKIIRGIKPNRFDIYENDKLINQNAANKDYQDVLEKQILKLNFKSFTQIVVLGSASFTPFMQLTAADRRTIIEDLLDIKIFSSMNIIVRQRLSTIKDEIQTAKYEMDLLREKIMLQSKHIDELKKHNDKEIEKKKKEIESSTNKISEYKKKSDLISRHITVLMEELEHKMYVQKKKSSLIQFESRIEDNISKLKKEHSFYHDNDSCPTCKQLLDPEFKETMISSVKNKLEKQADGLEKLQNEIQEVEKKLQEVEKLTKKISDHQTENVVIQTTINTLTEYIKKLNNEIETLSQGTENIDNEKKILKDYKSEYLKVSKKQEKLSNDKYYNEYAYNLLKDSGIKTKIIKQYLPLINKYINKYLTLMDSFINFNLDENFNESLKSRHRDDFSYNNFSEGEKQKIDLALLFTWRQIAKVKNSTNTNLLILDEVFDSSLDASSVELLMTILQEVSKNTNVFVISHKGDVLYDKFRSVIKFEKVNNFSKVVT